MSLDIEVVLGLKDRKENVSKLVNNYLREYLKIKSKKYKNLEELKKSILTKQAQIIKDEAQLLHANKQIAEQEKGWFELPKGK